MKPDIIELVEQVERDFGTKVVDVVGINEFMDMRNSGVFTFKNGKQIKLTATGKIVLRDNFTCKQCKIKTKYAVIIENINAKEDYYNVAFYTQKRTKEGYRYLVMTKDHIIPKSLGGSNNKKNYQLYCVDCNADKADTIDNLSSGLVRLNPAQIANAVKDQKELVCVREKIKETIASLPWYLKLLKVDKLLNSLL